MGTMLAILGMFGFFVGLVLLVIGLIRKKKMKGGLVLGISIAVFIVGFIMVPTNSADSTNNSKEKVETVAKSNDDKPATVTPEEFNKLKNGMSLEEVEKIVGGKPKNPDAKENDNLILIWEYDGENGIEKDSLVSLIFKDGKLNTIQQLGLIIEKETDKEKVARKEKALAEQKAKDEAEAKAKVEEKSSTIKVSTWQDKVKEVAATNGTPTDKYDAIMLYAKEYPVTEAEIKEFEEYIIAEYKSKNYVADINNAEYMLSNIFRANVINKFYGQVKTPINNFAFDFYQNTKYTYRGVETLDSSAVKSNERQMDKALREMGK